jgi:predicted nucleic acid-binding protein
MIVIDASVLADALIDDGPTGVGARSALAADSHWAAPAHVLVEVVSAAYVAAAETLGCPFVTADGRLAELMSPAAFGC